MTRNFNDCDCGGTVQRQWLFLGLSIKSFSASVNSLNEGGSVQVQLKEDPEPVCPEGLPKLKLNSSLQTTNHTGADPGWFGTNYDLLGRPVVFKHGEFEFAGLITRISKADSATSINDYSVEISSPHFLLEKVNLICGEYKGYVDSVPNLMNIYGLYENAVCDTFGNSYNYGSGMPWNKIAHGISVLSSVITNGGSILLGKYLQSNRIKYVSGLNIGCGLIPESDTGYVLDIGEVPGAPSSFLIEGNNVSLLEAIASVVDAAGYEYYIELTPAVYSGTIYKIIKIRTIDRSGPISSGSLESFIANYNPECGVISKDIGIELKGTTASNFVTGPYKRQSYYAWGNDGSVTTANENFWNEDSKTYESISTKTADYSETMITPYWGLDINGNCIFTSKKTWDYGCFSSAVYTYSAGAWTLTSACPPGCLSKTPNTELASAELDGNGDFQYATWEWDGANWAITVACPAGSSAMPTWNGTVIGETVERTCRTNGQTRNKGCYKAGSYMPPEEGISFFYANSSVLNGSLNILNVGDSILMNDFELIAAMQGHDEWLAFIKSSNSATWQIISASNDLAAKLNNLPALHIQSLFFSAFGAAAKQFVKPLHNINLRKVGPWAIDAALDQDEIALFNFVSDLANSYYGKKFMVRLPYLCAKRDPDTLQVSYNREVVDGGWPEEGNQEFSSILGVPINSDYIEFFKNEDGSIGAFVRFDNSIDLDSEELTQKDYGYIRTQESGVMWIKCSVDKDFVFGDFANRTDPRVVITLPGRVFHRLYDVVYNPDNGKAIILWWPTMAVKASIFANVLNVTHRFTDQRLSPNIGYAPRFYATPDSATIPLENKEETYGPWVQLSGTAGTTEHISDPDLVPWNYAGLDGLNTAGQSIAIFGVTNMYKNERGSITVPGNPVSRLGEEVLSFDGSGYITNQRNVSTRVATTVTSTTFTGVTYLFTNILTLNSWTGSLGPIITSLNISVGSDGIKTSYSFDLYSKGYKRFARHGIDNNKEKSMNRQKILSDIRRNRGG